MAEEWLFEVFRFPAMQSSQSQHAASLINYFRAKGAVESVFMGEQRLNSASVSENNFRIKTTIELVNT